MPNYSYKAVKPNGEIQTGAAEADDAAHLAAQLRQAGLELIRARPAWTFRRVFKRRLARAKLIHFFFSLEQFVRSGVPLLDGLASLRDSADERPMREICAALIASIENGSRLSQAMAQHPPAFDATLIGLARAGEESGNLADAFGRMAEMLKWQDELAAQTRSMMLYPAFTGAIVLGVTLFLLLRLVPQLAGFMLQSGQALPVHTRALLAASDWLTHYWHRLFLVPFFLCTAFLLALKSSPALRRRLDKLKLTLRPAGPILRKIALARLAHTFSMMYGSGIGILDCLANSQSLTRNTFVMAALDATARSIEAGRSFAQSLQDSGLFPSPAIRMIAVGETTGRLETALQTVGYFYDRDAKEAVKRLQSMIEPTMTITLGLILGWVMLSVLSPIYDLIERMGS